LASFLGAGNQIKQRAFEERNSLLADLSPTWPMGRVHITDTEKDGSRTRVFEIISDLDRIRHYLTPSKFSSTVKQCRFIISA